MYLIIAVSTNATVEHLQCKPVYTNRLEKASPRRNRTRKTRLYASDVNRYRTTLRFPFL